MKTDITKLIDRLTKEQRKIIYISLAALTFLILFWFFIYAPQSKKFNQIKASLAQTDAQINEISGLMAGKDMATAIKELRSKYETIKSRLPDQDEDAVGKIIDEAKKLRIEIKNITPASRIPLGDKVPGFYLEELPISLNFSCDYRMLGEYLNNLRNNSPLLIRIRRVNIKGKGEGVGNLDINLEISAYLGKEIK